MATLKERIRRMEDILAKAPDSGVNLVRCDLLRRIIRGELTHEAMTQHERKIYDARDNHASWERPTGWLNADELKARIRS
ncbi:hypothetical protein [Paraburkholderia caffeinilytica]|uniref:hypothetical protein n=1 Tax=Paraburkholderia caffeinilytica TaxID=1761016 RepID=UPI0038BBE2B7